MITELCNWAKQKFSLFLANGPVSWRSYRFSKQKYFSYFEEESGCKLAEHSKPIADSYYTIVTDLYEIGWGQSFHFARRFSGETFQESIYRHEYGIAQKLGLKKGDSVLDAGCGLMGPARNIGRFSGASIVGLNINAYQVSRCKKLNALTPFSSRLECRRGDFAQTDFEDERFDHVYSIEALCYASDRTKVFAEMFRVLKKGGKFAAYQWVLTDQFDYENELHQKLKRDIEIGCGVAELVKASHIRTALENTGFLLAEMEDFAEEEGCHSSGNDVPWYHCFTPKFSFASLSRSYHGMYITNKLLSVLEKVGLAPEGISKTQKTLIQAAVSLCRAGELGIFSPMLFLLATKPSE